MLRNVILILISLSIVACKERKKTAQKDKVTVGYLNMVSSLVHFVAKEKGFYEQQNIEVEGHIIKTSNLIAQEIATGHIDVGIELALTPLLKQLEKMPNTIKIYSTSSITKNNGFDAVLVLKNAPYQNLKDLEGKKVGGFPGTTAKKSFLQLFKKQFPELQLPIFVELTPNLHIQSLSTGEIDALFAYEPVLSTGKINFEFREIFPSVYGSQYSPNPIGVSGVNAKWLQKNTEIASRFFKAIDMAIEFIEKNQSEAKKILAKETRIKENIALNMSVLPLSKSDEIDVENLKVYLEILKELKEIEKIPDATKICIKQP